VRKLQIWWIFGTESALKEAQDLVSRHIHLHLQLRKLGVSWRKNRMATWTMVEVNDQSSQRGPGSRYSAKQTLATAMKRIAFCGIISLVQLVNTSYCAIPILGAMGLLITCRH
jgi:hypothetical protein